MMFLAEEGEKERCLLFIGRPNSHLNKTDQSKRLLRAEVQQIIRIGRVKKELVICFVIKMRRSKNIPSDMQWPKTTYLPLLAIA